MDEIAAEAGITKPIFYRHFGDRRGLAMALRDTALGTMLATPSGDVARDRAVARERIASFYPVVSDLEHLRRVIVGWATAFQMFVALNRNLYRFLRAEGVLDAMWEESHEGDADPVVLSLAASLRTIFAGQIDDRTAIVWAQAVRGMVRGLIDWASQSPDHDRFELERQLDLLVGALLTGLRRTAGKETRSRSAVAKRGKPRGVRAARRK